MHENMPACTENLHTLTGL